MSFISCFKVKQKATVYTVGKTTILTTMAVVICRSIAEKISEEKGLELNESIDFIAECIKEGCNTLR